jgi:hypothetical protein
MHRCGSPTATTGAPCARRVATPGTRCPRHTTTPGATVTCLDTYRRVRAYRLECERRRTRQVAR